MPEKKKKWQYHQKKMYCYALLSPLLLLNLLEILLSAGFHEYFHSRDAAHDIHSHKEQQWSQLSSEELFVWFTSENHRMRTTSLLKQGHLVEVAPNCMQMASEDQGEATTLLQLLPVLGRFPDVQVEVLVFQFLPTVSCLSTRLHPLLHSVFRYLYTLVRSH